MAKEFDIYLRNRLVECDLLVYSIPYHDGISVTNRLILEAALNSYLLHKFAAVQMRSEVEAHIDKMIKLCMEKLRTGAELDVSAGFVAYARSRMKNDPIVINAQLVNVLEKMFNQVESGLILAAEPLITRMASSTGRGNFPLLVDAGVGSTIKSSLLDVRNAATANAVVKQIGQSDTVSADVQTVIDSALQNLCYKLTFDAAAAVEFVALVLGTEIRRSLGAWYNGLTLGFKVTGNWAEKFIVAEAVATIMMEAVGKLIKVLYPDNSDTIIDTSDLNIWMGLYRLLGEVDDLQLADIDDMTLEELDYVWFT